MTARWPPGCCRPVLRHHDATTKLSHACFFARARPYASQPSSKQEKLSSSTVSSWSAYDVKAAVNVSAKQRLSDPRNPPRSTLPPPLDLPTRGSENVFVYWYRIGRAYGTFYKDGIKAVWYNYQAASKLWKRILQEEGAKDIRDAVQKELVTRAEFQLLHRNRHDIGKLPVFGVLVAILGEWLVFIVPYVPRVVPGTCRIPKQVEGMRRKAEERRGASFRQGVTEPSKEQIAQVQTSDVKSDGSDLIERWPMAFDDQFRDSSLKTLRPDQLHHLSSTLGLHSSLWDRVQLAPPTFLMRRAVSNHLFYITLDDILLSKTQRTPASGVQPLTPEELYIACGERGVDVLGRKDQELRDRLEWWLRRREDDGGQSKALFAMLFKRPNSWKKTSS